MKLIETPIQIRFVDIDQLGHVNNAVYLTYLEVSRVPYFNSIVGKIDWLRRGIILAKAEVDYKTPILLNDQIKVKTWCSRIGSPGANPDTVWIDSGERFGGRHGALSGTE